MNDTIYVKYKLFTLIVMFSYKNIGGIIMKKVMKTMVLALCTIAIFNNGTRIVNAKTIGTESKKAISINSEIKGMTSYIDPDSQK